MKINSPFIAPQTISEAIYRYMKKEIIEGRRQPNQRLLPNEIAKLFNVSSTPVRDAFLKLVSEGYLVLNTRKGFLVHEKTNAEVKQLYEIVRALDKIALRSVMQTIERETIDGLKEMMTCPLTLYQPLSERSYHLRLGRRRPVSQRAVRPDTIVDPSPSLHKHFRLVQRVQ